MTQFYELISEAASPVDLATMKSYMKVTSTSDDVLIQQLIDSATQWGENYTGRDFRVKSWRVFLDGFNSVINFAYPSLSSRNRLNFCCL